MGSQLGSCTNHPSSSPQSGKTPHNEQASAAAKSVYKMQMAEQDSALVLTGPPLPAFGLSARRTDGGSSAQPGLEVPLAIV